MKNPVIKSLEKDHSYRHSEELCTVNGVINKLGLSTVFFLIPFLYVFDVSLKTETLPTWAMAALPVGFILALIIIFAKAANVFTVPLYAAIEGVLLGGISGLMELKYPGIAAQAGLGVIGAFSAVFGAYKTGLIKDSPGFRKYLCIAALGLIALYFFSIIMSLFDSPVTMLHDSSPLSIGISIAAVCISSLFLVIDFGEIEEAVESQTHKKYEWFLCFGLILTLVWMYIEILHLLSKLRN